MDYQSIHELMHIVKDLCALSRLLTILQEKDFKRFLECYNELVFVSEHAYSYYKAHELKLNRLDEYFDSSYVKADIWIRNFQNHLLFIHYSMLR